MPLKTPDLFFNSPLALGSSAGRLPARPKRALTPSIQAKSANSGNQPTNDDIAKAKLQIKKVAAIMEDEKAVGILTTVAIAGVAKIAQAVSCLFYPILFNKI